MISTYGKRLGLWLRFIVLSAAFSPLLSTAAPVHSFQFVLTVERIVDQCGSNAAGLGFGCDTSAGDQWLGSFQIAVDPALTPNGGLSTPFLSMRLDTGDLVWDHCVLTGACSPEPHNALAGYRDAVGPNRFNVDGPGFYVDGGQLSGFSAGFFGAGDVSFIDFDYRFSPGAGQFAARDQTGQYVTGSYEIHEVPVASSLSLACLALLWLVSTRRPGVGVARRQTGLPLATPGFGGERA
jgi:hypothetical protein